MAYESDVAIAGIQSNLDTNLNATVTSRLGAIAGIDRGTISLNLSAGATAPATIGSVTLARSILTPLGVTDIQGSRFMAAHRIELTNSTTVTASGRATLVSSGGSANDTTNEAHVIGYQVVEYAA